MEKVIQEIEIRPLVPSDREKVTAFFRALGEEGSTFFNRHGSNERGLKVTRVERITPDTGYFFVLSCLIACNTAV